MAKKKKEKKQKKHPKLWLAIKIALLLMLLMGIILTIVVYVKYGDIIIEARQNAITVVGESSVDTFRANETSLVFDENGKQIAILKGDKDVYYITLENIPQAAKDAMIVTEDKKFYNHKGIDLKAATAAAIDLIKNHGEKRRGGSTITQQVSKLVFLTNARTWTRKIKEIFIALELEKKYNKDQILEFYMNNIYFANGYYGIEAASKGYFSKTCNELSLSELIFLCAIPNSPTRYDPMVNFDNTIDRRNRILDQMLADGKINEVEYDTAYNEEIKLKVPKVTKRNFIETYAMNCTVKALMKVEGFVFKSYFDSKEEQEEYSEHYSDMYSECQQLLFRSGYRVYTSINTKKQKMLQKTINETLKFDKGKSDDGVYKLQGAAVCIDNDTGKVVAIVGGRNQDIAGYTFNRAFQSYRQPGSAIKPILVFAPAFERDYKPTSIVRDEPIKDGPKNSNGRYMGGISLRTSVEQSVNTVAWKLFEELTPETCLNYLLRMNFSKIDKKDYTLSSSLGGFTNGVSPVELASAYATLENSGVYREPTCVVTITDANGNIIVGDEDFEEKRVYKKDAAAAITEVMTGVLTRGTARGNALTDMPCAGKTGTTNDKKDGWFAGYTPYYTTVVWVGNDIPKSREDLLGNTYPLQIWHNFMEQLHEKLEYKDFPNMKSQAQKTPSPYYNHNSSNKDEEDDEEDSDIEDNEPDDTEDNNDTPEDSPEDTVTDNPDSSEPVDVPADTPTDVPVTEPEPVVTDAPVQSAPTEAPASEPMTEPDVMPEGLDDEEDI